MIVFWKLHLQTLCYLLLNTDEMGSKAYVVYALDQLPDLVHGTYIKNEATIYLGKNNIPTNAVFNTVFNKAVGHLEPIGLTTSTKHTTDIPLSLFPNPVSPRQPLMITGKISGKASIQFFDGQGKKVMKTEITGESRLLRLNSLSPGVYFYKITGKSSILQMGMISVVP